MNPGQVVRDSDSCVRAARRQRRCGTGFAAFIGHATEPSMTLYRQALGRMGEARAERFLRDRGCRIVARRFRAAGGEIDLVALDDEGLVFVEVKARRGLGCGDPAEAVTWAKQRSLARAAQAFLARYAPHRPARFAVVRVLEGRAPEWIDHAFELH